MIPRITRGSSAHAALAYDFGPGRREEHLNPRTVAGNVPGHWREQAEIIDETVAAKPRVEKGIWRTSLRAAPEDRTLSDVEWGAVAARYVQAMGVADCPWTATRHGDDHVHLTVSRVSWEGKVKSLSHDYAKAQTVCRAIEVEHQLLDASTRYDRAKPQIVHGEREFAARRAQVPEREQLRQLVAAATTAAAADLAAIGTVGATGAVVDAQADLREAYESQLRASGVLFRANVASTGRVSGYSYGLAGHTDAAGEQVFFKGSQLGKAYTWAATSRQLQAAVEKTVAMVGFPAQSRPEPQPQSEAPSEARPLGQGSRRPAPVRELTAEQVAGMTLAERTALARAARQGLPERQDREQQVKPAPTPPQEQPAARQAPPPSNRPPVHPFEHPANPSTSPVPSLSSPSGRPLVSAEERERLRREHEAIRTRQAQRDQAVAAAEATRRQAAAILQRAEADLVAAIRVRDDVAAGAQHAHLQVDYATRALAAARAEVQRRSWVARARQQLAEDLGTLTGGRAGAPRGQVQAHLKALEGRLQGAQQDLAVAQRALSEREQIVAGAYGMVQLAREAVQAAQGEADQARRAGPPISMTATAYEQLLHREYLAANPDAAKRFREAVDPYSEANQQRRGRSPGPGPDRGRGHGR